MNDFQRDKAGFSFDKDSKNWKPITECNEIITKTVDLHMRLYEARLNQVISESTDKQDEVLRRMDVVIDLVKKEYSTNRLHIYFIYVIITVLAVIAAYSLSKIFYIMKIIQNIT
jgi:hypothetical protein